MNLLLGLLADRLKDKFKNKVLEKNGLKTALGKLAAIGTIDLPKVKKSKAGIAADDLLGDVIEDIMEFQRAFGLKVDGLLGPKTKNAIDTMKKLVHKNPDGFDAPKVTPDGVLGKNKKNVIRYFMQSLPNVSGGGDDARTIMKRAWTSWQKVCNIRPRVAKNARDAEVLIATEQLDGSSGAELARATIGPPKGRQLLFRIDKDEKFTTSTRAGSLNFEAMCVHEIGHLLGLKHDNAQQGEVMFGVHQPGLLTPQEADIARAAKKVGKKQ